MIAMGLELSDFRNYENQRIDFCENINVIYGDNAQGKTNILEAVYFFAVGKSHRARRDTELIRHGANFAKIVLEFSDNARENRLEAEIFRDRRKKISVNDIPIRKNSELVRRFNVVYFGPEYLGLVKEGPSVRRKNLDVLISQIKPGYVAELGELKKIIESKNALLRTENPNKTLLDIMNEKLAAVSANIIVCRAAYLKKIREIASEIQNNISGGTEELKLHYMSCVDEPDKMSVAETQAVLRKKIDEAAEREMRLEEVIIGPHREDIGYFINGKDARMYASSGQQKTVVMAQKLAEVSLMKQETGEMPVLLLDDIMSELDRSRREYILNSMGNMQILITCTDTDNIAVTEGTRLIEVCDGKANAVN